MYSWYKRNACVSIIIIHIVPAESEVVDICKRCHQDLTVKTIHHPTMARYNIRKVLKKTEMAIHNIPAIRLTIDRKRAHLTHEFCVRFLYEQVAKRQYYAMMY